MDPRVNVRLIGASVLFIFSLILATMFFIHKNHYNQCSEVFNVYFSQPVTGLRKGDSVVYNGIIAGHVKDMKPDPNDIKRVVVTLCIGKEFPIKKDATASIENKSITGGLIIHIYPGSNESDFMVQNGKEPLVIQSKESNIDLMLKSLPQILESLEKTVASFSKILNKETIDNLQKTIKQFTELSCRANHLIEKNEKGLQMWMTDNAIKLNHMLEQGSISLKQLEQILYSFNQSPRRFLYQDPSFGIKPDIQPEK